MSYNRMEMRSLSCVNVVHLICGIRTMKMNTNGSIYMVKRIKTKNNNDIENECLLLLLLSFHPFFVWGSVCFRWSTSTNSTFECWIYILYKLCGEKHTHKHKSKLAYTLAHTRSTQHNCTRKIYLYRGGWEDLSTLNENLWPTDNATYGK